MSVVRDAVVSRNPVCAVLSALFGAVMLIYELGRPKVPAVGPEILNDAVLLSVYLAGAAWICAAVSFARSERLRGIALIGVLAPFFVLAVEGLMKQR